MIPKLSKISMLSILSISTLIIVATLNHSTDDISHQTTISTAPQSILTPTPTFTTPTPQLIPTSSVSANNTVTQNYLSHNSTAQFAQVSHLPYAHPQAPKGGELSLHAQGTFNTANAWMTTGIPMKGTNYLYDTLMTVSLNEAFTMYPQLAEKVTFAPDDSSWIIYHLNPQAKFWDGSAVTSSDVKATFDTLTTKGPMWIRNYLTDLKGIETLDEQRVKFIFTTDKNKEILLSVGQFPIFKQSSIDNAFDSLSLEPLMGSGAYQLDSVNAGRSVTYKRDPNYWGKQLMVNRGRYNFDYITYVYYMSDEIAFEGFKAGQYKFREESKARTWATAYNFPAVNRGDVVKEYIDNKNPITMQALVMNQRRPLFTDIKIRQALTYAFDFEWMNKTLFYGQYERLQSYFDNSELEATGTPNAKEMAIIASLQPLIAPEHYRAVVSPWKLPESDGKGYHRQALLQARSLLLEAGCRYKNGKLYLADGSLATFEILLVSGSPMPRVILPYMRNIQRLGFSVSIREVDAPQYIERTRNYDYDMIVDGFMQGSSPGAEQDSYWGSQAVDELGNQNSAGIKNPAIDALIEQLAIADNRADIITYSKVLDRLLRAGYYMVPMYGTSKKRVAYWKHYKHATPPTHAIGIDYWWAE